jgi:hypothetical protein
MKSFLLLALSLFFMTSVSSAQTVYTISGKISDSYNIRSNDPKFAAVLTNDNTQEKQRITLTTNSYEFKKVEKGFNYTLTIEKISPTNDDLNGVTTLDMVMIQRHILGIASFDSKAKEIAADANGDNNVSVFDLVVLRKIILGIQSYLPESWRIRSKADIKTSEIQIKNLSDDLPNQDFLIIKVGDVNGNAY